MNNYDIRNCKKKIKQLKEIRKKINNKLYLIEETSNCKSCNLYNRGVISVYQERYSNCSDCNFSEQLSTLAMELQNVTNEINDFVENEYAKIIFENYKNKKILLIDKYKKQKISWDEIFGNDFEKVSKSLRYALIGLIEGEGRYELK